MIIDESFTAFLAVCEGIKKFLDVSSYEVTSYDSDCEVNFKVARRITNIPKLAEILQGYHASILEDDGYIVLRVYKDQKD